MPPSPNVHLQIAQDVPSWHSRGGPACSHFIRKTPVHRGDEKSPRALSSFWLSQKVMCGLSPPPHLGPRSWVWCGRTILADLCGPLVNINGKGKKKKKTRGSLHLSNVRNSSYNLASGKGLSLPKHGIFDQIRIIASPRLLAFWTALKGGAHTSCSLQREPGFGVYFLAPSFTLGFGF